MTQQREPLVDRFGRTHTYLRVSVTERCNLRCNYCMPPEGIPLLDRSDVLTFEEITRIVRILAEMGINKVRLTGGEPLVRRELDKLVRLIVNIPGIRAVCMTTNGVLLSGCADLLRRSGVSLVNISLDSLRPDRFLRITHRDNHEDVLRGIDAALRASFDSLKLNVVVMGGVNDDELLDFIEFAADCPINVRFIEFMPFESNGWNRGSLVPAAEMRRRIEERYELIPLFPNSNREAVASEYRIPGIKGTIGFIASMTEEFCGGCNRLRLMADGGLKTCLFNPPEGNLRDAMRSGADDEELEYLVRSCLELKAERHEPMESLVFFSRIPMIAIGG